MNKRATKRKSTTENYILKFLTVSSVSSDSIVKGIIDDIIKMAVKTAEVNEQKTKRKHEKVISQLIYKVNTEQNINNILLTSAVFTAILIMSSMIPLTILSLDIDETVGNLSIEFSGVLLRLVARLFMFLLIFNEQRVLKFTFVLVLTYYVNHSLEGAPHLFVILTAIG
jgi:hypothetical protein